MVRRWGLEHRENCNAVLLGWTLPFLRTTAVTLSAGLIRGKVGVVSRQEPPLSCLDARLKLSALFRLNPAESGAGGVESLLAVLAV